MLAYLKLMRPQQWYKNLVAFLPLFFGGEILSLAMWQHVGLIFVALCMVSSANYVLNDLLDIKKDRVHPEKKKRPLASRAASPGLAMVLLAILLIGGLALSFIANIFWFGLGLFGLTLLYSMGLKRVLFADILMIATNFVIRATAGGVGPGIPVSEWLKFCTFVLALFLAVGKRHADVMLLAGNAKKHKAILEHYTPELTNALLILTTSAFMMAYSLYSFARETLMIITVPFAFYVVFRYFFFIFTGNEIARHPDRIVKDKPIMVGIMLWVLLSLWVLYL